MDITKCSGENCKRKETCYRFTAPSGEFQYYFVPLPLKEDGSCDEYWMKPPVSRVIFSRAKQLGH